jgi:hypothetical protein
LAARPKRAPGVRVAPAPDATWLATSSSNERHVYRLANGKEERQDGVPKAFARTTIALALAPDSTVHLASDTTAQPDYAGGVTHATLKNGSWSSSVVFDRKDKYTPIVDLELGSDGAPRVWIVTDAPNAYSLATPDGKGGWTLANAPVPAPGAWNRFTLAADGSIVSLAFQGPVNGSLQLHSLIGGADKTIGGLWPDLGVPAYAVASAAAPTAPSGPLFAVAMAYDDGIHVFVESKASPETESVIAGATPAVETCFTPGPGGADCKGTCHKTTVGMEKGAFALAWTDDGTAWVAYVITKFDQTISYSVQGEGICFGNVDKDASQATLHVVRVPQGGGATEEVLSMPIDRPGGADAFTDLNASVRFIDARGFGKDLAIGARTGWITGPNAVRVLRVDTTKL